MFLGAWTTISEGILTSKKNLRETLRMDMIVIKNLGDCPEIIDYFVSTSNVIFL